MKSVGESTQKFYESIKFSSNIYKTSLISTKQNFRSNLDLFQEKQFNEDKKNILEKNLYNYFDRNTVEGTLNIGIILL